MSKINLNAHLISDEENLVVKTSGIKTKNTIIYKENEITVTIKILSNKIEMNRSSKEYKINLIFEKNKKTMSTYNLFGAPKVFELETYTKMLKINDKKIEIEYELEGNKFSYSIEFGG